MLKLRWNTGYIDNVSEEEINKSIEKIQNRNGEGSDFLGWLDPEKIAPSSLLETIKKEADRLKKNSDCVVVTGIGGSYLGARAVLDALSSVFSTEKNIKIVYAGNNLSEGYLSELLEYLDNVNYSIIVISKSGTTTETAVAFRLLQRHCENKYGFNAKERIVCITDREKGALKALARKKDYPTYILPDDVGGRYSVLTPVGLLPIAVGSLDINALVKGAIDMKNDILKKGKSHDAVKYAIYRNSLYRQGKLVEVMASFEPKLQYFIEWWKQLFGESEGKDKKGIFPAGVIYTTDLHSMGQFMQDGSRIMMESFLMLKHSDKECKVNEESENLDQLNYLKGKNINSINEKAYWGTVLAHEDGGVPSVTFEIDKLDEYNIGQLIYFFEYACAASAYILGVNPFNQPGVEAYKKNMFTLLGKPSYESGKSGLEKRISEKLNE